MDIRLDSLEDGAVIGLLEEHLKDMYATSPAENVHALQLDAIKHPSITFWSAWQGSQIMGCVAVKQLSTEHGELKSMRTSAEHRNKGVASQLLRHVISEAKSRNYDRLSLETGSQAFFQPAHQLYEKYGFSRCGPFADYLDDPHSVFMALELTRSN